MAWPRGVTSHRFTIIVVRPVMRQESDVLFLIYLFSTRTLCPGYSFIYNRGHSFVVVKGGTKHEQCFRIETVSAKAMAIQRVTL